jgi:hypothetical protein
MMADGSSAASKAAVAAAEAANSLYQEQRKNQLDGALPPDSSSASNVDVWRTTHMDLQLTVNFPERAVDGVVTLSVTPAPGASVAAGASLVLDVHMLAVHSVSLPTEGVESLAFEVKPFAGGRPGSALHIALPPPDDGWGWSALDVVISYTAGEGPAFCWLEPEQTAGASPFLLTQGQACRNRSLLPCMDTPSVRVTYTAAVRVPTGMTALMSAEGNATPGDAAPPPCPEDMSTFRFQMEQSSPVHLLAVAVGELSGCSSWAQLTSVPDQLLQAWASAAREGSDGDSDNGSDSTVAAAEVAPPRQQAETARAARVDALAEPATPGLSDGSDGLGASGLVSASRFVQEAAALQELRRVLKPAQALVSAVGAVGTAQRVYLLDGLLRMAPPMTVGLGEPASAPLRVDTALGGALSGSTHAEIRLRWALLLIKHEQLGGELDLATFEAGVLPFLREQGNQKYILPAYTALVQGSAAARTLALQSFKASAHLHALVRAQVVEILRGAGLELPPIGEHIEGGAQA